MPDYPIQIGDSSGIITVAGDYKPGDPPPSGYNDWHEWAAVQHKAGLRQKRCGRCVKWKFPQELSEQVDEHEVETSEGNKWTERSPVCLACADSGDVR